jgi:hypothetical protein
MADDNKEAAREFDACYSELLRAQAAIPEGGARIAGFTDEQMAELSDVECAAVWKLIKTPAVRAWQVCQKLQVLEDLLKEGGATWADRREHFLLASARLDLSTPDFGR